MSESDELAFWVKRADGPDVCPACGLDRMTAAIGADPCPVCYVRVVAGNAEDEESG
jgi:uncharacterized Zn finger protein (UPF0148 family)